MQTSNRLDAAHTLRRFDATMDDEGQCSDVVGVSHGRRSNTDK